MYLLVFVYSLALLFQSFWKCIYEFKVLAIRIYLQYDLINNFQRRLS